MARHPIRKALGLTVLYSIIIIGIFILQFRNESVILKNIGLLRLSVAQTQGADGSMTLKNTLNVTFRGVSFTADDVHPATLLLKKSSEPVQLILNSWEQTSPTSCTFNFTENTSITFAVSDTSSKASLSVTAQLPDTASSLSLHYTPVSGYSVTEQSRTRQLFSSKNVSYTMSATDIQNTEVIFTASAPVAAFTRFDPSKTFTFASIPSDSATAKVELYEANVKKYRSNILAQAATSLSDTSTISENTVAAYVAEKAYQGQYSDAIQSVPDAFKKGSRRSYFTAPYFNSLVAMNASLVMANNNFSDMINNAITNKNPEVFAVDNIDEYLLRTANKAQARQLTEIPASISNFQPTLAQATGIIRTYMTLAKNNSEYAPALSSSLNNSLEAIASYCTLSQDHLTLSEKETPAGFIQTIETGSALINYGKFTSNKDLTAAGYMLINTAFAQTPNPDLRTQAEIYPVLVTNNVAYPHTLILNTKKEKPIWAWTVASNITYDEAADGKEANLYISFKQNDTHYIIINGIKPFAGIEIYGLSFHTDARFESYNSSGYVYDEATQTLYLKSRHKATTEKIRLVYGKASAPQVSAKPQSTPASTAPKAEEPKQDTQEYTPIPKTNP